MATQKDTNTFNQDQKELLNIIINNGNKDDDYEILVNDIIDKCSNKNPKSVRSKLTTVKMKKYLFYTAKTVNNEASVKLLDQDKKSTFQLVNQMLEQENKD